MTGKKIVMKDCARARAAAGGDKVPLGCRRDSERNRAKTGT